MSDAAAAPAQRQPVVLLTRIETFSAAHRLHSPHLSDEENKVVFGKCNNINGHGHNYKVHATVRGKVDTRTGMVINLTDLKTIMKTAIMEPMDHRHLDLDVPYFKLNPSTTENVAVFIWESMLPLLAEHNCTLDEVRIEETSNNIVVFRGQWE